MPEQLPVRLDISKHAEIDERATVELQAVELIYEFATGQYRRAVGRREGLSLNLPGGNHGFQVPDRGPSVTAALGVRHDAFENYRRALEVFNKLVTHGEQPELRSRPSPLGEAMQFVYTLQGSADLSAAPGAMINDPCWLCCKSSFTRFPSGIIVRCFGSYWRMRRQTQSALCPKRFSSVGTGERSQ
jgi:hypothetical protein